MYSLFILWYSLYVKQKPWHKHINYWLRTIPTITKSKIKWFDIYIWHVDLTFIFDIYIWHLYLTCISYIYIWNHLYMTSIFDIYLWHLYLTSIFHIVPFVRARDPYYRTWRENPCTCIETDANKRRSSRAEKVQGSGDSKLLEEDNVEAEGATYAMSFDACA